MLDDEARRSLEEEAIALVSLSNPTTHFLRSPLDMHHTGHGHERMSLSNRGDSGRTAAAGAQVDNKALVFAAPCRQYAQQQQEQPQEKGASGAIHPMLQAKANLIARRDGKLGTAPARKLRIKAESGENPAANGESDEKQGGGAFLSMEVFVNGSSGAPGSSSGVDGDLKLAPNSTSSRNSGSNSSLPPPKRTVSHAGEELYAQNPTVSEEQQQLDVLNGNISMKSLLVTLKKRKLSPDADAQAAAAKSERAKVLPSFREVFESPHQPSGQAPSSGNTTTTSTSPSAATAAATATTTTLTSAELKCKYRTGKCSNVRALKSCGDYHNLCNYHRLRANANQRKLDRKKKVQRQQTTPSSPQAAAASLSSSPASVSAASALCAPSAAAAAALVAMPTSAPPLMPYHQHQRYDAPPPFYPGAGSLDQSSSTTNSSSDSNSLHVKQERGGPMQ